MTTDGLLVVDKPPGMTSHTVVSRCRKILGQKRVGHAGTLDPDATGVLLVGAGRVTRLLRFLGGLPKVYEGELVLGSTTTTLDASGEVTGTWDMSAVRPEQVAEAARALTGAILQVPPMVSAVQIGGRRLHELARQGIEVDRPPRPVTVHRFDVEPAGAGVYRFCVSCSSGTYVRSLVDDLGRLLGGGAHLGRLRRTAVGGFGQDRAVPLDQVGPGSVLPPAEAVAHLARLTVGAAAVDDVGHGRPLDASVLHPEAEPDGGGTPDPAGPEGPWAVTDAGGELLAVYERQPGTSRLVAAVVVRPL